jgi:hypothetical protein
MTRKIVNDGISQYMPGASLLWSSLHFYFNVNNSYVVNKLKSKLIVLHIAYAQTHDILYLDTII